MSEPTLITADDDEITYLHDHLTHFFDTISYNVIISLSQADKERYFKMVTDHESMITNLYGESVLNSIVFLPVALRNSIDNDLVKEYKTWLDKQ